MTGITITMSTEEFQNRMAAAWSQGYDDAAGTINDPYVAEEVEAAKGPNPYEGEMFYQTTETTTP